MRQLSHGAEPDEPFALSWRVFYAAMVALAKAAAAIVAPANSVVIEWPDALCVDGTPIGGGRLAWPDGADAALPPPWLIFGVVFLLALYFVGAEEGATSIIPGMYVHEFVHDGRHLLGFPCH